MNRWSAAKSVFEEAHSQKIDSDFLHERRFEIAFLERDWDRMKKELEWEKSDPSAHGSLFFDEAAAQLYFGHARVASTFVAQAVSKQLHAGLRESAAINKCQLVEAEADIGETARAKEDATSALVMSPSSRDLQVCTSFVLARLGNGAEARRTALEIKREKPSGTLVNGLHVPTLMGAALLSEKNPAEALRALEPSIPYFRSDGLFETTWFDNTKPTYLRGIALLELKRGREAIVEFQKLIDHPGLTRLSVIGPLARLQLARAQMMIGDRDAARNSYQDFLTLWQGADPDIPIYKQAKAEYAKLQ